MLNFGNDQNIKRKRFNSSQIIRLIANGVREGTQAFVERLKKRKLDFPSEAFMSDVNLALSEFVCTKGLPSLDTKQNQMRMLLTGLSEAVTTHQKAKNKERKEKRTEPTA